MAAFVWDEHFLTHIPEVDEQHHGLVDLINAFGERVAEGEVPAQETAEIVERLRQYARFHFREEEELMATARIDARALATHQRAHHEFNAEVERIADRLPVFGEREGAQVLDYLVHWLGYHILGVDQSMARQLQAIRAGSTPAVAYEDEQAYDAGPVQPLLDAIASLLRTVEAKNRELQASNVALERRVAERTHELERLNEAMHRLAMHDPLTGLPNRRQATDFLDAHWTKRFDQPVSCLMIDADHFKEINDLYGHEDGDRVLKVLAMEIRQAFRSDDLVCRLGGDEFLVVCPRTALDTMMTLAENLLKHIHCLAIPVKDGHWQSSLSIGAASTTADMATPADLLRVADEGLYAAKAAGRDSVRTTQAVP